MTNAFSKMAKVDNEEDSQHFYVYLLISTNGNTYVGATVNPLRRIRQHNGEIKGGAYATSLKVGQGEIWTRVAYVSNFPTWQSALQFEWRWKQISRKYPAKLYPLDRRMRALNDVLKLNSSTTKAIPYSEWSKPPEIHFELDEAREIYNKLLQ